MRTLLRRLEFLLLVGLFGISLMLDGFFASLIPGIRSGALDYVLSWVTHVGSVAAVLIIMTTLFLWQERKLRWVPVLWASIGVSAAAGLLIKVIVNRARPISGMLPSYNSAFPSIHAAVAFACLPVLDREFPRLKWFWACFAVFVGFSRVYFSLHYLSDVFAGALLGLAIGHFFVVTELRRGFFRNGWARLQGKGA